MANVRIQMDLTVPSFAFRWLLALALLMVSAGELASESVTLNTYYPAPSGVYTQMITTTNNWMARDSGSTNIGTNQPLTNTVLTVHGDSRFNHDVTIDNNETVTGSQSVGGNETVGGGLTVSGNAAIGGWETVGSNQTVGGNLQVNGNSNISGSETIAGNDTVNGIAMVNGKYLRLPNAYAYCSGRWTSGDVWNTLCAGTQYVTYTAGVYVDGWSYQARGNTSMDSSGDSYVLCCSK